MKKKALGKGLKAFLPEDYGILKEERFAELDLDLIKPSSDQPRSHFDPKAIDELSKSIKESGVLQPIVVVPELNHYKIIVGERRWRAAQKAGLEKIPALIRPMGIEKQLEISLVENLQREDLNPMEVASAYHRMAEELNYTQEEIAVKVGKDRASIANYMRLLKLPGSIQKMLAEQALSMGHARALLSIDDSERQRALASQIARQNLSVRTIEKIAQSEKKTPASPKKKNKDPDLLAVQDEMVKFLGTKVDIAGTPQKGTIKISYYSLEELNRIFETIKKGEMNERQKRL
jgi:ParB family transcriptional regulator, chromosome partitioning protein